MWRRSLALLALAGWLLVGPVPPGRSQEESDLLLPGPPLDRPIAGGASHTYRVVVSDVPLVLTVNQQSVDLVLKVHGPGDEELQAGLSGARWGPEVVLLEGAGERRIEVRPKEKSIWPGRYSIGVEALAEPEGSARRQALALMSRAGQEGFDGSPEARQRAAATCREALAAWQALADRRWEAEALTCLATLEYASRELKLAIEHDERALAIWRDLGERHREAAVLNELGLNRIYSGDIPGSREALAASLALWKTLAQPFDETETRSNVCFVEQSVGDLPAARACYEEPRAVFRDAGVQSEEQRILGNLGGILDLLGEPDAALDHYRRSLDLCRALGDEFGEANALNNIGVIHRILGEWQEALRLYGQSKEIAERIGNLALTATVLANISVTYNNLGEPRRALAFAEDSLKLRKEIGDRRGEAISRNSLGNIWRRLGDLEKALDSYRQALALTVELKNARQEAFTRLGLGDALIEKGDALAALREIEPAVAALRDAGLRSAETQALQLKGRALTLAGRAGEALPILQETLERQRALHNRAGEAGALHALAVAERSLGRLEEARAHAEAAIAKVEELRTGFVSPELRSAFLATQRRVYALLIDLLMDRHAANSAGGWDQAALAMSEQARARTLLDALYAGGEHGGSAIPAELLERRQSLRRRLSAKADQQAKQTSRTEALTKEIEALLTELDRVDAEIGRADPRAAAFRQPQPIELKDMTALLDPGTVLLEYALGEEKSYLWMVGAEGLRSFVLPPQREIEELARRFHEEVSTVSAGAAQNEAAESLGKLLLGEVWSEASRASRLVVVPDAALHYVPFVALRVPDSSRSFLLEHDEVVYLPSATTLVLSRKRLDHRLPAARLAAVLADPVFGADDPRLPAEKRSRPAEGEAGKTWTRLPGSGREAEAIAGLVPSGQVWSAVGFEASREAVLSGKLADFRVIHFATHGVADARNPEMSGLVLSLVDASGHPREGFLSLSDVYEMDLHADLVVLSGCRTGFGKEVPGEGLMGFTRGFLYAGVPRVVASLWQVQDRATAELMGRFYRGMWAEGLTPSAALRAAQRQMRNSQANPAYRGPYSWAGFVLQGDWK